MTQSVETTPPTASVKGGRVFLSVAQLRDALSSKGNLPLLLDARAERQYRQGHLPGAVSVPARELNPIETGVRRLASESRLGEALGAMDLERDLVVYGSRGGADAAHLWWTLSAYGVNRARLLDGGVEAWEANGLELVRGEAPAQVGADGFRPGGKLELRPGRAVSADELLERLGDDSMAIVDTRHRDEYSGKMVAAKRGGHVPGAVLIPWTDALTGDLRLRSEDELRELLAPALEKPEAIVYCQSGVRAAHTVAVLEMLGHPRPRLYLESWSEWGNRDDTPVEVEAQR